MSARINYTEMHYKKVTATTEDTSTGTVIPDGETIYVSRLRSNGASDKAYVVLIYDNGGPSEKIFSSSKGDIDIIFDSTNPDNQITGNGTAKLQLCLINDDTALSPIIGGAYELTIL